jgi:hypothetical protein
MVPRRSSEIINSRSQSRTGTRKDNLLREPGSKRRVPSRAKYATGYGTTIHRSRGIEYPVAEKPPYLGSYLGQLVKLPHNRVRLAYRRSQLP